MSRSIPALINPELLIWARQTTGLSLETAAKKLGQPPEKLATWENSNEQHPTIPQLRKLADIYKRPLALFYLPHPPETSPTLKDFRRLDTIATSSYSPELRSLIRNVQYRREAAIDLAEQLNETPPLFPITAAIADEPENLAKQLREAMGISYEIQTRWKDQYAVLKNWIQAVESLGVLVFQSSNVEISEMRGCSISADQFPAIVINSKDAPNARIFTLMHELTHIALRNGGVCNFEEDEQAAKTNENQRIEIFCNRVAGAILVPYENLIADTIVKFKNHEIDFTSDDIAKLAKRYQVSKEVITRRLLILNQVSQTFYQQKRQEFIDEYQRNAETSKKTTGAPPVFRMALGKNGYAFTRLVLDSYNSDRIHASDLSDYLDIRLKHLPALQAALFAEVSE